MQRDPLTDADDRRLLAAVAAGNEDALAHLYRRYSPTVYALARRITGKDPDAQDVVAEVFWELWDKSARYCPSKASPYTYLIMLARCRALDRKRGLSRNRDHGLLDWVFDENDSALVGTVPPTDPSDVAEVRELVTEAVAALDPKLRTTIELTFFDGLTHKAAADKLGIPLGTVKGRIRSALEKLRIALHAHHRD